LQIGRRDLCQQDVPGVLTLRRDAMEVRQGLYHAQRRALAQELRDCEGRLGP
jgi:hypothetical protein